MLDEVKRHSESGLGPLARALRALTVAACLAAGAVMAYGIYNFPDAPIRPAAGGYAGKHGEPRTREDFEAFVRWERTLFVVFPSAFALGFASAWADRARRRRRS
jgi:hypothetical protein